MQENTITLPVDLANDSNLVNVVFTRFEEQPNRTTYIGSGHSFDNRNTLGLYRTFPTKNGNFRGVAKSAVKFTKDISVAGVNEQPITAPVIIDITFSVPVGTDSSTLVAMRQKALSLLDTDLIMDKLNRTLEI